MALRIIHITDTHYAMPGDDVQHKLVRRVPAGLGPFGPIVHVLRKNILSQDGARCAEPTLWREMLRQISSLVRSSPECVVVHTGDLSQAGQASAVQQAYDEIVASALGATVLTVPGNHDLWPHDFPPFAASRTPLQSRLMRNARAFPKSFPTTQSVGSSPSSEFVLLDSCIADSLLNTVALGALEDELSAGAVLQQLDVLGRRSTRLRIALVHHPVADIPSSSISRNLQAFTGLTFAMVMLDASKVRNDLVKKDVSLVLCGHEHRPPLKADDAIIEHGKILLLQAGCPTLLHNVGNSDEPQLAVYELTENGANVELTWNICALDPTPSWSTFASYTHDGTVWRVSNRSGAPPGSTPGVKQKPPPVSLRRFSAR